LTWKATVEVALTSIGTRTGYAYVPITSHLRDSSVNKLCDASHPLPHHVSPVKLARKRVAR